MRSLEDARARWQVTSTHLTGLEDLKQSVKRDGDGNPCILGLRSVCWKTFLLFQNTKQGEWPQTLADSRSAYTSLRGHLLRFIENPDELGSALDPLDDNLDSPWNTLRQDDEMRAEIFQDVERCMPEEPYFRQSETQRMLLDILFVFCKINQDVGYRQGMHEVLAPILWVVDQDSIDVSKSEDFAKDSVMRATLDRTFIEHDAFTLLSLIMRSAKSFYELGEPEKGTGTITSGTNTPQQGSPIVERSKRIHEDYLARVDPELAKHLMDIEVLPQIFLIRWIRLIFGREFPFDDLLGLWDTLFAEDPGLDLIDLVCVAMLLRIRWELLDSNYSFALMLLLKYPAPKSTNGPKTFVEDAAFLRGNLTTAGGVALVKRYSGRSPQVYSSPRPSTPAETTTSPRQRLLRTKSPLPSPARFLQQQGSVGELFQGAAKGLLDRSEKLGINQAVRDAVEEAKKNMQTLQTSRSSSFNRRTPPGDPRWSLDEGKTTQSPQTISNEINARNRQLARMLDQAMLDLRATSVSKSEEKETYIRAMDLAIAKVEFVKVYLEDSSMPLPNEPSEDIPSHPLQVPTVSLTLSDSADAENVDVPRQSPHTSDSVSETIPVNVEAQQATIPEPQGSKVSEAKPIPIPPEIAPPSNSLQENIDPLAEQEANRRPPAPLPTRSSIAQSNFAWMLESDESASTGSKSSPPKSVSPFLKSGRRPTSGASRDKAAFLFGEDSGEVDNKSHRFPPIPDSEEGFNMGAIKSRRGKSQA